MEQNQVTQNQNEERTSSWNEKNQCASEKDALQKCSWLKLWEKFGESWILEG